MSGGFLRSMGIMCLVLAGACAQAADLTPEQRRDGLASLPWVKGPADVGVGDKAKLKLGDGLGFLPEKESGRFLELTGNLPSPGESILVSDTWWAAFDFADVGYVKDDEKLDPDALLKDLKSHDEPANVERRKRGLSEMHTDGWAVPPHYDPDTKHLEWGLKLHTQDHPEPVINYTVRLLGRNGYENVILVSSPEGLDRNVAALKGVLKTFEFNAGEKYSEFKQGDRIAEFGLGALIVGGTAAALAKTGFWKTILVALAAGWKVVLGGLGIVAAGLGNLFKKKKAT